MIFLELWYTTRNILVVIHSLSSINTKNCLDQNECQMGEPQVECRCNGTMSNIFMSKAIQGEGIQWMNIAWMNLLRACKWKNSVGAKRKSVKEQTLHFPLRGTLTWVRMIRKVSWESSSQTGLGEKCSKKWIVPISKIILPINQSAV